MRILRTVAKTPINRVRRFVNSFIFRFASGQLKSNPFGNRNSPCIAIIRPDNLGDFILTTPLFKSLRLKYPNATIHLFVSKKIAPLARGCPEIDSVVEIPNGMIHYNSHLEKPVSTVLKIFWFTKRKLRPLKPDMVILPRVDTDHYGAIWMATFSRADLRIAFSETSTAPKANLNQGTDHLFTDVVQTTQGIHEVESLALLARHMDLDTCDWKPYLWWSKEDYEKTDRLLQDLHRDPLLIIAPGASEDRRRWLPSSFGEVGQILESLGFRIVILGSAADIAHGDTVLSYLKQPSHLNLAGKLSLMQSAAVMARATAFLGNDSGPLHMAAAVGIPCVEISSFPRQGDPTHHHSPSRFGPWRVKSVVLQPTTSLPACKGFCSDKRPHCICQVKVSEVVYAIKQLAQPTRKFVDPS